MPDQWPEEELKPSTDADVPFGNEGFEIPEAVAPEDADSTLAEQGGFQKPPLGPNLFIVDGFLGSPKSKGGKVKVVDPRTGRDEEGHLDTLQTTVKLTMIANHKASILLNLLMPPGDPAMARLYWYGIPWNDVEKTWKKQPGYQAHTFRMFIDRLFHDLGGWPQGKPMPPLAKNSDNWVGRQIIAEIKKGFPDETVPQVDQRGFVAATAENVKALETAKAGQTGVQAPNARAVSAPATRPVSPSKPAAATRQAVQELDM
jgi:hypothetical protein